MSSFPPLLPADGSFSNEMLLLQGVGHRPAFYNRPPGARFFAEFIGDHTEPSFLPLIFQFWLEKLGMAAEYRSRNISPNEIEDYVASSTADLAWRGCNLSPSLKRAAVPHVSLMAKSRESMPFVDTLFRYKSNWPAGMTTVGAAIWTAFISSFGETDSAKVWPAAFQIVGSGAVATTIAAALMRQRIPNIWIYARNPERGRHAAVLAGLGPERVLAIEQLRPLPEQVWGRLGPIPGQLTVLINATPLGSDNHPELAIDLQDFAAGTQVIDFAYKTTETALVRRARAMGFRTITNAGIAIEQAAQSFFFFYLTQPPREHDAELLKKLGH